MEEPIVDEMSTPQADPRATIISRFNNKKGLSLLFIILTVFVMGLFTLVSNNSSNNSREENKQAEDSQYVSDNVVLYGYWKNERSIIALYDLSTDKSGVVADLPYNIKHVKVLSPQEIIYISDTNERDHGTSINVYNIEDGVKSVIYNAEDDFGIDDYVVSPNGQNLSVWEVKVSGAQSIGNGKSRVYASTRAGGIKNLIYDEVFGPGSPVNYPIGITDLGDVYTDKFLANSGAGWSYGMSRSNFDGTLKSEIATMQNGTYSSQPVMSRSGKYIAFSGYDGENGALEEDGFRRALLNPNTVEVLNLDTLNREVLVEKVEGVQFPYVLWDQGDESKVLFSRSKYENSKYEIAYAKIDVVAKSIVDLGLQNNPNEKIYSTLTDNKALYTSADDSGDFLGNLGGKYERAAQSLFVVDLSERNLEPLSSVKTPAQLIALRPSNYFSSTLMKKVATSDDQLKLDTFELKPTLAPVRQKQQADKVPSENDPQPPLCRDVASEKCNRQLGTNYEIAQSCNNQLLDRATGQCVNQSNIPSNDPEAAKYEAFFACYVAVPWENCADSPLYLYGDIGTSVHIEIGTVIHSPNFEYSPLNGVSVELASEGEFYANGNLVDSLEFDYKPAIKTTRPEYGVVVKKSDVGNVLSYYSDSLGLNEREKADVLSRALSIRSDHAFVSFYDEKTSKSILPIYFSPQPDNYHNIVFYLEGMDNPLPRSIKPPKFEKIKRDGFTAVEISFIVRK